MSEILDTYGNKTLKTCISQYWNRRYEIWEDDALRLWSHDEDVIMRNWNVIKETEPPIREKEKMPFIDWNTGEEFV